MVLIKVYFHTHRKKTWTNATALARIPGMHAGQRLTGKT
jgi:hypothetical protein